MNSNRPGDAGSDGNRFGRRSTVRAALMTTGSAYISYLAGLISTAVLARTLGPATYGVYAYFVWLTGLLWAVYNSGFVSTSIRFISENIGRGLPGQSRAVMGWVVRRYLIWMAVATVGFVVAGPWLKPNAEAKISLLLLAMAVFGAMAKSGFTLLASFGKGYGRFEIESVASSVLAVGNVVGVLVLAFYRAPLLGFAVFFLALCVAHLLLARPLAARAGIEISRNGLNPEVAARLSLNWRWSALFALLATFSASSIEIYLLERTVGAAAVAYFSLALAFARAGVNLFIVGISSTVLPVLSHAYGRAAGGGVAKVAPRALRYAHVLGMVIAGLGFFLAFPAIKLLYGGRYLAAVWILQAMVVAKAFTVGGGVLNALFVANDQQRGRTKILAAALVVNIGVAVALVPKYGLSGAVFASVLSGIIDFAIMLAVAVRELELRLPVASLLRLTMCGGFAAIPAYFLVFRGGSVVLHIGAAVAFCCTYVPLALVYGKWDEEDLALMRGFAGRFPRILALMERFGRRS